VTSKLLRDRRGVTLVELLIAVAIIAVVVSVSAPGLTTGRATVRLSSASGDAATFLTRTMNNVETREEAAAVVISPANNAIETFTAASGEKPASELKMPQGISIEGEEQKRIVMYPGGVIPRVSIVLRNEKGARRSIEIDPITAIPKIQRVGAAAR
jgi:prepilin-type N-terminal cleavage/methylation domain-containing protein